MYSEMLSFRPDPDAMAHQFSTRLSLQPGIDEEEAWIGSVAYLQELTCLVQMSLAREDDDPPAPDAKQDSKSRDYKGAKYFK
jgi:hypothetical protein